MSSFFRSLMNDVELGNRPEPFGWYHWGVLCNGKYSRGQKWLGDKHVARSRATLQEDREL